MSAIIIYTLLTAMAVTVIGIALHRNLFVVIVLFGIYSFLMAMILLALDAPDVAMTEAAVGAGISSVLLLAAIHLTGGMETRPSRHRVIPLLLSAAVAAALIYATFDLSPFSDPQAAIHTHVADRYLISGQQETGVPNIVTAVLASYRGYDTLGETVVVFTAGIGVVTLMRRREREVRPK